MKIYTCTGRYKKGDRVVGYRIQDENGNTRDVEGSLLKGAIKSGEAVIFNLSLTVDGKLRVNVGDVAKSSSVSMAEVNRLPKVIDMQKAITHSACMKVIDTILDILDAVKSSNTPCPKIEKLGYRADKRGNVVYVRFASRPEQRLDFVITQLEKDRSWKMLTPLSSIKADDFETIEQALKEDIVDMLDEYQGVLVKTYDRWVSDYESLRQLDKEFGCDSLYQHRIRTGGNNVVYMEPLVKTSEKLTIPSGVTVINSGAFNMCPNLHYIKMDDGLVNTTDIKDINKSAFSGCSNLQPITLERRD